MFLEGIKILDLTRLLPFDYGSMLLGDMGAEVVKIEDPSMGDYMRWIPPIQKRENYMFLLTNRNKKSVTLNLKKDKGREIFLRLAQNADVIFESFRPGVVKRLGIDYKTIRAINRSVIYCSCTGYGQTGPYRKRLGHDINYLGISGVLSLTGRDTGAPVIPGLPVADMTAGVFCALGICSALIHKMTSGEGQYLDISMTDCMVSYLIFHAGALFGKTELTFPITGGSACYEIFKTKDRKFLSFGNLEDKFWFNFCDLIEREDLKEFKLAKGQKKEEVLKEVKKVFRTKTQKEWLNLFEGREICYGPVNELDEVFSDPQIKHRQMYFEIEHQIEGKIGQVAFPIKFSKGLASYRKPPPSIGEHTEEFLKENGYSEKEISDFRKDSII